MPFLPRAPLTSLAALGVALLLAGCASTDDEPAAEPQRALDGAATPPLAGPPKAGDDEAAHEQQTEQQIDTVIASVDDKIEEEDIDGDADESKVGDEISHATTQQIPLDINTDVERWIEYFTVKDRERFQRFLERGEKYRAAVTAVLKDQGIPTEIYYQAMIESGFATAATSRAKAVGIWQFIPGTGRRYGLRVDGYVDERRDPLRSTIAASLYLKDLYNVFQSWYLAMSAYNAGEGRIMGAIMRAKTRDFWEMVKTRALPDETMNYIPKFLAATIIGHDPAKYGFDELHPETQPQLVSVAVPSPIRLSDVAAASGVPLAALKDYNPHLLRAMTPPGVSTYRIWVPKDQAADVEGQNEHLATLRVKGVRQMASINENARPKFHTVVKGDTLAVIAGTYGVSVKQLKRLNHLRSGRLNAGQRLTLWTPEPAAFVYKRYKVKRGDNLDSIAHRFNLSIDDLKKMNRLKRNKVFVGQVLKVGSQQKG